MSHLIKIAIALSLSLFAAPAWAGECGDGNRGGDEQCDDGNLLGGDGCNQFCFVECGTFSIRTHNSGFEFPGAPAGSTAQYDEDSVPGWFSTATDDKIEFWGDGAHGVSAHEGSSFIELNANEQSGIYTYIDTVPGMRIEWSLAHQSYFEKDDKISVLIGTDDDLDKQGDYTSKRGEWKIHDKDYKVPQGQYRTRIQIESKEKGASGNLIDSFKLSFEDVPDPHGLADCPESPMIDFQSNGRGRVQIVANGVLSCQESDIDCANAREFNGVRVQNSQFDLRHIDADSDAGTFNSSSAALSLQNGETVVWAGLYWMGAFSDFNNKSNIIPPSDPASRDRVLFRAPSGQYEEVQGSVEEIDGEFYQGFADVTSQVSNAGEYWVANMQVTQGRYMMGGWSLVVVTADDSLPARTMTVIDTFQKLIGNVSFSFPDFAAAHDTDAHLEVGVVMYDGDVNSIDFMLLNGNMVQPAQQPEVSYPYHAWDLSNSSISRFGYNVTDRTPSYPNNFGYDADVFDMSGASLGETTLDLEIRAPAGNDVLLGGVFTFQTDLQTATALSFDERRPLTTTRVEQLNDSETLGSMEATEEPSTETSSDTAACTTTRSNAASPWWMLIGLVFWRIRRRRG